MKTYQDFLKEKEQGHVTEFIKSAIEQYRDSPAYKTAQDADEYEAERNVTVMEFERMLFTESGEKVRDFTVTNHKMASNYFHRLTTQRVAYSLGNGISFPSATQKMVNGKYITVDETKEALGKTFDTVLYKAGKFARIHGVSYLFWNHDHADLFKMTEFCPLYDEDDGLLKAGFRFWSLDWDKKPVTVVMYETDGYTKFVTRKDSKGLDLVEDKPKTGYVQIVAHTEADGDEVIGENNYSALPIVPLWGSTSHQSDLVGMRGKIDVYDLINSGYANDVQECAEIYWIVSNAMGMTDNDLAKFRDRIKFQHIAVADTDNSPVTPYTQEIPVNAKESLLNRTRAQIYEDYGGLDVHTVAAGATNDHIDAAYQPMDEEADDFEYQIIQTVMQILALIGKEDIPIFLRNRISNKKEQTEMVMMCANYLDDETVIKKLPFITPDEVPLILANRDSSNDERFDEGDEE